MTPWDAVIVGAGPAGLTAAMYLARYRRRVLVLHDEQSRALRIPFTQNVPGFPEGIAGKDLVDRMSNHAERHGAQIRALRVETLARAGSGFTVRTAHRSERARSVILATGLRLNQIPLDQAAHEAAISAGVLRYCPVCDAFEHIDQRIAVIGSDRHGAREALFLRRYTPHLVLFPAAAAALDEASRSRLGAAGVEVCDVPVGGYELGEGTMQLRLEDGSSRVFDVVYPALGVRPRTGLAQGLGLVPDDDGCLAASAPYECAIPGFYSIGDVVSGLDQVSVAMGHGAAAATKAHTWLREADGETLD